MRVRDANELLTVREVATELRVVPLTIYRRVASGDLGAVRLGESGPLRVPRRELDRFLRPAVALDNKED